MAITKTNPIVIKFGGEVVESPSQLLNLIASLKQLFDSGENLILVHGGGPLATRISKDMNLTPTMVGGRRVTCEKTLEVMKMVLPGIINSNILAILKKHNLPCSPLSGINLVNTTKRPPKKVSGSDDQIIDFGFVGDIHSVDPSLPNILLQNRIIPVISPLSADQDGQILNINADTVAVQIAKATHAKKLILVTSIGGIFQNINDKNSRFTTLTCSQAKEKIKSKVIEGGMIPKLEESFNLFDNNLDSFHIVGVDTPESIINEIINPGSVGTAITK